MSQELKSKYRGMFEVQSLANHEKFGINDRYMYQQAEHVYISPTWFEIRKKDLLLFS